MEQIFSSAFAQYGPWLLVGLGGWVVAYFLYKENTQLNEKYTDLLERVLAVSSEQSDALEKIAEGLAVQKLLVEHFEDKK